MRHLFRGLIPGTWRLALTVCVLCGFPALGAQLVTATLTVTNIPLGAPPTNLTVNAVLRAWTNAQSSSTFLTNLVGVGPAKTNLYNQIAANPYSSPSLLLVDNGTNSLKLIGTAVVIDPQCSNWCSIVYSTNQLTNAWAVIVPFDTLNPTNRTNNASQLVYGIDNYSTNKFSTNSPALANFLSLGVAPGGAQQQITQRKNFSGGLGATDIGFTNGFTSGLTNINPVTSNLVNYGSAVRSEGNGGNSFQMGSNALAQGTRGIAIGNTALSSNADSIAIGTLAVATNQYGVALGNSAQARGLGSIAIGFTALATANSGLALGFNAAASDLAAIALGVDTLAGAYSAIAIGGDGTVATAAYSVALGYAASATHSNSAAIGPIDHAGTAVATTTTNQLRFGTANHTISAPGLFTGPNSTNANFAGTNTWRGDLAYPRFDVSTLAAGNNIAVPFGTNVYIRLAAGGLAGAPTICGIVGGATTGGRDGQEFRVLNDTGFTTTWAVNTVDPVPANRINTYNGVDFPLINGGWVTLLYDGNASRWKIASAWPQTNIVASTTNAIGSVQTNSTFVVGSLATNLNIVSGTNVLLQATNSSGNVSVQINVIPDSTKQPANLTLTNIANMTAATNQVMQLLVYNAKLPGTNMPYFEGAYNAWELDYPRTNVAGGDIALSATWSFTVPNDYATNTMAVRLLHTIIATNGPNSSNVIWRCSFLHAEAAGTDIRVGSFGTAYLATNTWAAAFNVTNVIASNTINFTNQSGLSPNGFGILKVERVSTSDTYVGAAGLVGLTLEYGKQ